jgi:hypothetical protein
MSSSIEDKNDLFYFKSSSMASDENEINYYSVLKIAQQPGKDAIKSYFIRMKRDKD